MLNPYGCACGLQFACYSMTDSSDVKDALVRWTIPGWVWAAGLSLLVSLAVVWPFFWLGSASGHDFEFHVASWLDVSYQWSEGTFYPRWTAWTNHGFGEPRFIFYPPLSWMLGAALTRILPLPWVPACYVLLVQTLAGLCAYFLLRRLTSERGALLGAACYVANPNALLINYVRSDFAEQLACALFPLLLLGTLRITRLLKENNSRNPPVLALALPFAAVWLCNAPAGVIASYSVALVMAWALVTQRSWKIALRGAAGIGLGFGLIGFYLVPAAYEQRWVNIAQALASGLLPWQNFLFTRIDDVDHTWFNFIASWCAVLLMLLFCGMVLLSRRFAGGQRTEGLRGVWGALLVLGAGASLLMFPFTNFLWMHLPKLRFVQFPWRCMSVVALIYACFVAAAVEKRRGWLAAVLLLALSVPLANVLIENSWWDPDEMPTQDAAVTSGGGFEGTDEYDPMGDDHLDIPANAPLANALTDTSPATPAKDVEVKIVKWSTENKEILVTSKEATRVALRALNYPAWRVSVNGRPVAPKRMDDINQMVVPVEEGRSVIEVRFGRTGDRIAGNVMSLVSVVITGMLVYLSRKKID
jgi:hypothetical protein